MPKNERLTGIIFKNHEISGLIKKIKKLKYFT